ncbi:MAG: glycosyltransferase family 39 protein [Chloroflexi bacterium]|nr:glycosyltransferase family 39 protein [Chloroflexota bacterium]MCI0648668.1 glycosyltransferase family 39 protein [Chloroflexota bacterium]MCI0728076.1 glycosyltransferase family 39 protein [Chloroflexota bacterium]
MTTISLKRKDSPHQVALHRTASFLAAVLLVWLAFALRTHHLDHFGFWQDEGLTPLRAGYSLAEILSNRITIQEGVTRDTHPPLYYLAIHVSRRLLGESDFAFRYPSVLASVLLVPLLYQFGRRLNGRATGIVAALLAAVNPLHVWYAQEARMYTLAVLLGAAASYALWRAMQSGPAANLRRWFTVYILFAGLAFLTHYTAAFLVAAQGLLWAGLLWRRGQRRLIIGGALAGLLVALPFMPGIIPRLFTGAEANYHYVSPLIMLQDVVHGFGMGLTVDFRWLAIRLLDVGVALLLLVGITKNPAGFRGHASCPNLGGLRLFLLVYLLAIVAGLALGSLIKPMYQGARHIMIGSPAFFLLLARGVQALPRRPRLAPAVGLLLALAGPAISLANLYLDPQYAKDDVRALVATIEQRAGDRDVIVYNNAILLGLHWHYQERTELPVTALPVYPFPATAETTNQLQELAGRYERIWFVVEPPAVGLDAAGLVSGWLEERLLRVERHAEHARTMRVEAIAYTTTPWQLTSLPAGSQSVEAQWDETLALQGWQPGFAQPAALSTLWLDLFWQAGQPPPASQQLRFALRGPDGQTWLDDNRPFWPTDTTRLFTIPPTAQSPISNLQSPISTALTRLSYGLSLPAAMPPGDYELLLLPWDKASGAAGGEWASLGVVTLAPASQWPRPPELPVQALFPVYFANGWRLLGVDRNWTESRPGHNLPLYFFWQAPAGVADDAVGYELEVVGPDGQSWFSHASAPGPEWLAPADFPAGAPVREYLGLSFPAEAPPGVYRLRWRLRQGQEIIPGRPAWRPWSNEWITFGEITLRPWPLVTKLPAAGQVVEAQFGPAIQLYGYDAAPAVPQPGQTLELALYWRALAVPQENYYAFVHLVAPDSEEIVYQVDRIPVEWLRPTKGWRQNEILSDAYQLPIPADLPPGNYRLYVGLYNPDSFERPAVTIQGQPQPDNRLLLMAISVP